MSINSLIKSACVFLLAMTGLLSCTKDPGTGRTEETDSALVRLSIRTPSSSVPKVRGETSPDEEAVSKIKLVVLQLSGGEYRYRYMTDGQQIVQSVTDSQVTTFDALLTSSDVPLKVLLVANYNAVFDTDLLSEDMSEATVKALLTDMFDPDMEGRLPLYGELSLAQLQTDHTSTYSVTMLRAVARVDVNNTIDTQFSEDFTLESVYIYRANDLIGLAPGDSALQTEGKMSVSSATVPSEATVHAPYSKTAGEPGAASIVKSYLPESLPVTDASRQTPDATCVVVGGYYGKDTEPSYYRIDFDSGLEGHPFGQVLRNHKYVFNILQVNGRGWETPDDAANNRATAIIATMQVWDELTSEMWFSGDENYLGISSRRVVLNYFAGSEKTETLQATVPFRIQPLNASGNPTGSAITTAGQSFQTEFYKVELKKDSSDGEDVWRLEITSLADNMTDTEYTGGFQVYTDWWTFDVEVIQESYVGLFEGKYVRILTITDLYGDLGTTDGTFTELSGGAMRKVLENPANFSPTGTVTVGGIIVYDLKNATISSQTTDNMYILQKVLNDVDVVHLPSGCTPSPAAAGLISAWHSAKANRVLIIGFDTDETNANLRSYVYQIEEIDPEDGSSGTWNTNTKVTQLGRTYDEPGMTDRFFYGPFGEVAFGDMGLSQSTSIGYNNGYNAETTAPLLMITEAVDNKWMMTHGVNLGAGLVYFGDSGVNTNRGSAMSDTALASGSVSSDFDRLMGNLWAWIVERVGMVSDN